MREFFIYCRRLLLPLGLALALAIPEQMCPEVLSMDGWAALLTAVGGPMTRSKTELLSILDSMIPIAAFLAVTADFFRQDFIIAYVYVFTRFGRKSTWFFRRLGKLFLLVFAYVLCRYAIAVGTALAFGCRFSMAAPPLLAVMAAFFLEFMFFLFLSVLVNCLSLPLGESKAFVCVLLLTAGSLLLALAEKPWGYLLPFANGQLFWHDGLTLPDAIGALNCAIPGFTPAGSLLSSAVMTLCTVAVSGYAIAKKDLLTLIGDE